MDRFNNKFRNKLDNKPVNCPLPDMGDVADVG